MSLLRSAARRFVRVAMGSVTISLMGLGLVSGCDRTQKPEAGANPPEAAPGTTAQVQPAASHKEQAFSTELSGPHSIAVGERTPFIVTLRAGTGYKVNPEYPHKFKIKNEEGLSFTQKVIEKASATISKDVATFPVEVVATSAGPRKVAGQLAFSVCTAEKCLIERSDLELEAMAK